MSSSVAATHDHAVAQAVDQAVDHAVAQAVDHAVVPSHPAAPFPAPPPREILDTAGDILRALAAPVRIALVLQLRETSRCVHELVEALDVPQPLVSQHLRILKSAGVVAGDRSGREVRYRLVDHHLAHIVVAAVTHAAEDLT